MRRPIHTDSKKVMREQAGCQPRLARPGIEGAKKNGTAGGRPEFEGAVTENR